jgi:hypothetical protein
MTNAVEKNKVGCSVGSIGAKIGLGWSCDAKSGKDP